MEHAAAPAGDRLANHADGELTAWPASGVLLLTVATGIVISLASA